MTIVRAVEVVTGSGSRRTVTTESMGDGETGNAIMVYGNPCAVTAIPATSGKVQYTTSAPATVFSGNPQWIDWAEGTVTSAKSAAAEGPVIALRGVSVSGNFTIEVVQ